MPESFREFWNRRVRELGQSPEWAQLGKMSVTDFGKMIENEYYDCAEDPVPPDVEQDDERGSLLQ